MIRSMASVTFSTCAGGLPMLRSTCPGSRNRGFALNPSQFFWPSSVLKLKRETLRPTVPVKKQKNNRAPTVFSLQSNFFRVVQTVLKVGKDGIEAGTNLVPDAVPRPIARISVTFVALTLGLFVVKSFISTAFFVLATMGLIYFTFIAFNKNEAPKRDPGPTSTSVEDSLEEARRIMDKYK